MKKFFLILFVLSSVSELGFIQFGLDFRFISKPLIMASLMGYYLFGLNDRKIDYFLIALFFGLIGDILLLRNGESFFLAGLVAFLIMQVIYTFLFLAQRTKSFRQFIPAAGAILIYGIVLNYLLWPSIGSMKIPVVIYSVAIMGMALSATMRNAPNVSFFMVFIGVLFFIISDSLLALDKFALENMQLDLWTMLTYILAQFLIVHGYLISINMKKVSDTT